MTDRQDRYSGIETFWAAFGFGLGTFLFMSGIAVITFAVSWARAGFPGLH
jgi:hypothetical protein